MQRLPNTALNMLELLVNCPQFRGVQAKDGSKVIVSNSGSEAVVELYFSVWT